MAERNKQSTEAAVREIRRRTRRKFAPEEKIRIVLEGLRGEQLVRIDVEPVVDRPPVLAGLISTAGRDPLAVLRQPQAEVDTVVVQGCPQPAPVAGHRVPGPELLEPPTVGSVEPRATVLPGGEMALPLAGLVLDLAVRPRKCRPRRAGWCCTGRDARPSSFPGGARGRAGGSRRSPGRCARPRGSMRQTLSDDSRAPS